MGNFDTSYDCHRHLRAGRTILRSTVGSSVDNDPEDLRRIAHALRAAGYLRADDDDTSAAAQIASRDTVLQAIRLAEHVSQSKTTGIRPASAAEIALRRVLAQGNFPRAHRAALETMAPVGARNLIGDGMRRARARLAAPTEPEDTADGRHRRAALPGVSATTRQANICLTSILAGGGEVPELSTAIAGALERGGRQSFADVRDLWQRLGERAPDARAPLGAAIAATLSGRARRRFQKLMAGESPTDADFS